MLKSRIGSSSFAVFGGTKALTKGESFPPTNKTSLLSQTAFMYQRGKMAASVICLFVSVTSLRGVKSGGHWSESPSHWLFLYVKPFNVALRRYHEAYFTSQPVPPGGIRARLRGLPRRILIWHQLLEVIHCVSARPKLSACWLEPHKYSPYCYFYWWCAF